MPGSGDDKGIAIIGMACRFPGGADRPERLWHLLAEGRDAIEPVPQDRWPDHAWDDVAGALAGIGPDAFRGGFLTDLPDWDARFFGVSPAEARRMDPQHRMIMEVAWRALEDAGLGLDGLASASAGLFIGLSDSQEFSRLQHQCDPGCVDDPYMAPGASTSVVAGRLAAFLDARGPALAVDTACSSALVAMHLAMRSLEQHDCDLAIVPAAAAVIHPESLVSAYQIGMLAPDGRSKAFDRKADGFVIGEGAGALVLERVADAAANGRRIRAIALGSAVNQNGRRATLAAPSMAAQADVIRQALDRSHRAPGEISYIEAHAVGTVLGDAIELDALRKVFGPRPDEAPLHVGTVKPNLGHTLTAAGMASLIKAVLILEHRRVPPTINLADVNPVARRSPWLRPAAEGVIWLVRH
jgi:polyketide synthase 12